MICPVCYAKSKNVPLEGRGHSLLVCLSCERGKSPQFSAVATLSFKNLDGKSAVRFQDLSPATVRTRVTKWTNLGF